MHTNLSYVHGASDVPLSGETIGMYFDKIAARFADREAIVSRHQNIRWTYREFRHYVDNLAAGLRRLGFRPGDRVGIWSQNCAEWALVQFATAKTGIILVNINPAYRRTELEYALNKVGCVGLILSPRFKSSDYLAIMQELAPELKKSKPGHLHAAQLPSLRTVIHLGQEVTPGMLNFKELLTDATQTELGELQTLGAQLQFDDPINIQFTSGTTGTPKGATLTHHNILNNSFFTGETMKLTEEDRVCVPVPLYHCFGMVVGNLGSLTHGATTIYPDESFDPKSVLETIQAERCTAMYGVPTMFIAVLDHPDFGKYDVSSLRTGIMAGSPCPIEVMKRVVSQMHMPQITIACGMTEVSPVSFQCSVDDELERRVSTVGRVHPHVEAKVVDTEGRILPRGEKGELLYRGYSVMRGYWDDETKTREAINEAGWMHSGDLATIDDEGYCNIVGRSKDMVIRGGENIYPREVEEFLYRHPKIQDVQCVGVPDPKYGEELCACVMLRSGMTATPEEIQDFCRGQIAHYKVPRYVKFVEGFPMTVTGKIQKFVLRQQMAEELGLKEQKTA